MNTERPGRWRLAIGLVLFQAAWFACVLGAAHHQAWAGLLAVAAVLAIHEGASDEPTLDLLLMGLAVLVGFVWDTLMARCGLIVYASPEPSANWAPPWILALWALFATLLREPLPWLHGRWPLAAVLGAVGGPLSYASAVRLGAGRFPDARLATVVLAIGWAVMSAALIESAHWLVHRRSGRIDVSGASASG